MSISQANPAMLKPGDGHNEVIAVGVERRHEAITRLLSGEGGGDPSHTRRFLDYAQEHSVSLEHLWAWVDQRGRFQAVALAVPGAGRSAMCFVSQTATPADHARIGSVLKFGGQRLQQAGIHLAQALVDPHDTSTQAAFFAGGFQQLATLSYLERPLRSRLLPPAPAWPDQCSVSAFQESQQAELIDLLDATYEQTLDCPGLRGHRTTADILEGHRSSGHFDPRLWTILRIDGQAAGALLLNPAADHSSIELVYLGLSRSARGRGLGAQLLRYGLHLIADRPERVMSLAVDDANWPALELYTREHFRAVLRRTAMIRPLRPSTASNDA